MQYTTADTQRVSKVMENPSESIMDLILSFVLLDISCRIHNGFATWYSLVPSEHQPNRGGNCTSKRLGKDKTLHGIKSGSPMIVT